ncbi:hypothetical protein RQP46_011297 [Phenoliferia psychrophenolica]
MSDEALTQVLHLVNYVIMHNYFPESIQSMLLMLIHKKNSVTELKNYRGITLANFIAVIATSRYTQCLQQYAWKHGLLPEDCWARAHGLPLYWFKRDQKGGYDKISPQGWKDAVQFYGLPNHLTCLLLSAKDFHRALYTSA